MEYKELTYSVLFWFYREELNATFPFALNYYFYNFSQSYLSSIIKGNPWELQLVNEG